MGNFYSNVVVRGAAEAEVTATLESLRRRCFVVVHEDGLIFIYDAEADEQKEDVVGSLALTLATRLKCPTLASLNHDDDVLLLWLYDKDGSESRFGSGVQLDDDQPSLSASAFAEKIRQVLGTQPSRVGRLPWTSRLVEALVSRFLAVSLHRRILGMAGVPVTPAILGYKYVERGELTAEEPHRVVLRIR